MFSSSWQWRSSSEGPRELTPGARREQPQIKSRGGREGPWEPCKVSSNLRDHCPMTYRVADLRGFERTIFRRGGARRSRYLELEPNCWMCPAVGKKRTREHVFGQWIMYELPEELLYFTPHRPGPFGGEESDRRGPMHLKTLQVRRLCEDCNSGWMSELEVHARRMLFGARRDLGPSDSKILAHWALKTAVVLNVSQPAPLVWNEADRHRLKRGPFERTFVSVLRVSGKDVNWGQGEGADWVGPRDPATLAVLALMPNARIRLNDIVLVIVRLPWQMANSSVALPGRILWDGTAAHRVNLDELPLADDWLDGRIMIDGSMSSAFWRSPALDFWRGELPVTTLR